MNKGLYRLVFNAVRGVVMVVGELAQRVTRSSPRSTLSVSSRTTTLYARLTPVCFAVAMAVGGVLVSPYSHADIVADANAPANQQPQVSTTANGTPQVNIQTPSRRGVSHNTYSQFDVDRNGVILNNSAAPLTQTQQAGLVTGNPNVANGPATIILNEVNSADPSTLNGFMEVAGKRADVIVANPAGITCSGCGFVNTKNGTLTTGTPIVNNGTLDGYRVEQGSVTIGEGGLDASTTDFTHIISRAVQVNAAIVANDLKVTTGRNQVNATNTEITALDDNVEDNNSPTVSVDVSALGGMYAGKITLVGTEDGVGVRNAGEIGASIGEFTLTSDGRLENSGRITAAANLNLNTQGDIDNQGIVHSGENTTLNSQETINNQGTVSAYNNTTLNAQGDIIQGEDGGLGAGIDANSNLINASDHPEQPTLTVTAEGDINLQGHQVATRDIVLDADTIALEGAAQQAQSITLNTPDGDITVNNSQQTAETIRLDAATIAVTQSEQQATAITHTANDTIDLSGSDIIADDIAITATNTVTTDNALLSSDTLTLDADTLSNRNGQLLQNTSSQITANILDNTEGRLHSNTSLTIDAAQLNNNQGEINSQGELNITANNRLDNTAGRIATDTNATLTTGAINNDQGLIQANQALSINTQNQALDNTNAGTEGGIIAGTALTIDTGTADINNEGGYLNGESITLTTDAQVSNRDQGAIESQTQLTINANSIDNRDGQVQSGGDIALTADNDLNNEGGLVRANDQLTVNAATINNTQTNTAANRGLEAATVTLRTDTLDNTQGRVIADNLSLQAQNTVDNTNGLLSASQRLQLSGQDASTATGQVNNNQGTVVAGQQLSLNSSRLLGAGDILSEGTSSITLEGDYTHISNFLANDNLSLTLSGNLTNQAVLGANSDLTITSASLDNTVDGELSGTNTRLNVSGVLTNYGLIDSRGTTGITAQQVDNIGTGRVYGNHVAIQADTLNNQANSDNMAAVIAARNELDIGVTTLNNQNNALIHSAGDFRVGGELLDGLASGQATTINNESATLEARGAVDITAVTLNNLNPSFALATGTVVEDAIIEYQRRGSLIRYTPGPLVFVHNNGGDKLKRLSTNGSKDGEKADENFTEYRFTRTTTRDVVANTNPAAITAAGDITLTVDSVNNQASQIIAGAALTTTGERLASEEMAQQTVTEQGESITYSRRRRDRRRDAQRARRATYAPTPIVTAINLNATVYQENTDRTTGFTVAPSTVPATITGATAVNTASLNPRDAARIIDVDTGDNSIRTVNLSPEVDNNSLFQQNPADTASVLVETDPRFTNNQQFLSSDFVLLQLDFPESNQKRLGDGFYEQRLVREQMVELTGLRFLDNYTDEEQQYQDLLDNGIAFAQQHQLIPGVRLSDAQMQQLTDDMVWLETQTVTLRDGTTQQVLVPRLYAVVQPGDLYGTGALLSGRNVNLNSDQLVNSGSVIAREHVNLNGQQLRDTRGRLQGNRIVANTGGDSTLAGSRWRARNQLDIQANNLTLSSTGQRTTLNTGHRDDAGINTSLFVTGPSGSLSLNAQQDLTATGSHIANQGTGATTLTAGNDLNLDAQVLTEQYSQDGLTSTVQRTHTTQVEGGGDVTLRAGQALNGQGVDITAGNNLTLDGAIVALTTAEDTRDESYKGSGYRSEQRSLTHDVANLNAGNTVSIQSSGDLTLQGTNVTAGRAIDIDGEGDTTISAVQDEAYTFTQEKHKRSFGRSETRIEEQFDTTVVGGQLTAGNATDGTGNISINTEIDANGNVIRNRNSGKVLIDGAQLSAGERIAVDGEDVTVIAQKETHLSRSETHKKGVGGLNNSSKGRINREQVVQAARLYSVEDLSLLSSGNVTVLGSEVVTDGSLNIDAADDVIVSADEALSESKQWSKKTRFFSDIDSLYTREDHEKGGAQGTAIGSTLSAGEDINITASRATVIGSDLTAGNDINATTDVGDLQVLSVDEAIQHYQKDTTVKVGLSDVVEQLTDIEGQLNNLTDVNNGQARLSIAKAEYDQVDTQTQATSNRASTLNAGGNVNLDAAGDLATQGSDITADTDNDGQGDIHLKSGGDILLTEAEAITDTQTTETHGTAELSLVVQHQAVEVAKAARALETAKENIKDAKEDYRQYQKDLKKLKGQRDQLQADYDNNIPGIAYADIVELDGLIDEVASDEEWYQAGVVLAVADAASKTTLLIQQTGAAKNSVATYGFNAGLQLDIDATQTESESHQESSRGTRLSANNITLTTGDADTRDTTRTLIQGSHLDAKDSLTITTGDLDVMASQDTHSSQTDTEQQHIRIAQTVYGAAGGPTVSVSASRSQAKDSDTVYTNSTLQANTITLNTTNDATFKGATVNADDTLKLDVKGDLLVQSVQDRHSASNKSAGVSAGFSLGSGANAESNSQTLAGAANNLGNTNGEVSSVNGGLNASNGRERSKQTVLTSLTGGTVDITVDKHTALVGATIAAVNEDGNDNGQLNLDTQTLDIADLSNTAFSSNRSGGISTSVGIGDKPTSNAQVADPNQNQAPDASGDKALKLNTSNVAYSNNSTYEKSKTLATIGEGNITVRDDEASGEDSTERLNRDITATEKDLYAIDRQQGNIDLTVDHRLLSAEGRKQIKEDVKRTELLGGAIGDVVTEKSVTLKDLRQHITDVQKELDVQKQLAQQAGGVHAQTLNSLDTATSEQKQAALDAYAQAYSDHFGLHINDARLIAVNTVNEGGQAIAGFHYTQGGGSVIVINDLTQENALTYSNTVAHEVTHAQVAQGRARDRDGIGGRLNEEYARIRGDYAEDVYGFSFSENDLGEVNTANTNQHRGNTTSATVYHNHVEILKDKPQDVEYFSLDAHREMTKHALAEAKEHLHSDGKALKTGAIIGSTIPDIGRELSVANHANETIDDYVPDEIIEEKLKSVTNALSQRVKEYQRALFEKHLPEEAELVEGFNQAWEDSDSVGPVVDKVDKRIPQFGIRKLELVRSHYGDKQWQHAMGGNTEQVVDQIVKGATGRAEEYWVLSEQGNYYSAGEQLGSALHFIQDSYSGAHTARDADGKLQKTFDYNGQSPGLHAQYDEVPADHPSRQAALAASVEYIRLVEQYRGDKDGLENALRTGIFVTNIDNTIPTPAQIRTTFDEQLQNADQYLQDKGVNTSKHLQPSQLPNTIKQESLERLPKGVLAPNKETP